MDWQLLEWYRGCPILHRPGLQRRGYLSVYHNHYRDDGEIGSYVHHSEATAKRHIDKLHKDLGQRVELTPAEFDAYMAAHK